MKKEEFRQKLKSKRQIKDKNELIRTILYEALQKEFWNCSDEEVMIFTTLENFTERLQESYDFSKLSEGEIKEAELIAFERLENNYNILAGPEKIGDKKRFMLCCKY